MNTALKDSQSSNQTHISPLIFEDGGNQIAGLIRSSIPNALVSHLGLKFGSVYYSAMVTRSASYGFVANDPEGNVVGVLIGSLNSVGLQRELLRSQIGRLLFAANVHLLKPAVVWWLIKGVWENLTALRITDAGDSRSSDRPLAELLVVAVRPDYRGSGISAELVECFENALRAHASRPRDYCIHTEVSNLAANKFYSRLDAELALITEHHGREINQWRKRL